MQIGIKQISISDRVNAAKTQTSNKTDTSSVPSSIDPSPGNSNIAHPDTSQLDSAGANVNQQTQQGNKATSDSVRKSNNPAAQNVQYDKQTVSSEDQAPTASKKEELSNTPQPKSKGFKESLIDAQMANMMGDKTGGNKGSIDSDFGHNNGNPSENINGAPDSEPIKRTQTPPYDPSRIGVKEPQKFPITSFDKSPNGPQYTAPEQDLGPQYKQKGISAPKVRFNTPKINTPRFN
jgi:hypothetical protein